MGCNCRSFDEDETRRPSKARPMPKKTFHPIGSDVALYIPDDKQVTERGIVLPENMETTWFAVIARVIAVGPACGYVQEGDDVIIKAGAPGTIIRHRIKGEDGRDVDNVVTLLREECIGGIINRTPVQPLTAFEKGAMYAEAMRTKSMGVKLDNNGAIIGTHWVETQGDRI
jgi:co-chaperonin GroES (HSP10)